MTESTTATRTTASVAEKAAVNRAAKAAGVTAAEVSKTLPTVVETAELAMEVPSKVVLNQKMVVAVSVVAGAALGVGVLFGAYKLRERMAKRKLDKELADVKKDTEAYDPEV